MVKKNNMGKISIRCGVFETNSSSVHSITLCKTSEFKKWLSGEYVYSIYDDEFKPISEVDPEKIVNMDNYDFTWMHIDDDGWYTTNEAYIEHNNDRCYDTYSDDKEIDGTGVTAFGYYGNDY